MDTLPAGITHRIEILYSGTLDSLTAPDLYVNGVLSAMTVTADTSTAGLVVLTHGSRTAGELLTYVDGEIEIDGATYPLAVSPQYVMAIPPTTGDIRDDLERADGPLDRTMKYGSQQHSRGAESVTVDVQPVAE